MVRLDTGEEVTLAVCYFDLFFVAEEDVLFVVVHEVDWVDWLVVGWPDWEEFAVVADIIDVEGWALANAE